MSGWLGVLVWAIAASALHLRGRRRLVLAARAGHEVRGPLCTAQLALDGLERSARVDAIGLELRRAALALDDLALLRRRSPLRRLDRAARSPSRVRYIAGQRRSRGERVDLARLLVVASESWRALADAHAVELAVRPGRALVLGDPLRLAQALANLVANAIEHGGGHVCVSSSAAGGRARVEIVDLGPGLPASVAELVAAARGRRTARGHGLAIAAAVARSHGGTVTSLPSPIGARLVLDLPEAVVAPPRRRSSPAATHGSSSPATPHGSSSPATPHGSSSSAAPHGSSSPAAPNPLS